MLKETLIVPKGIRYISDWKEYNLRSYNYPHIVNKQITGCGFTEYCLTNDMDVILCSPRRILLDNKFDQHSDIFYFKNELDQLMFDYDKDLTKASNSSSTKLDEGLVSMEERFNLMRYLKNSLLGYISKCRSVGNPIKILVTYDSFHLVRDFIESSDLYSISAFQIIIDEFQSVFVDSRFKSNTEMRFLNDLRGLSKICFVSATPMIDRYLEMLDDFKDLPYFEIDWKTADPLRVIRPNLIIRKCTSLIHEAKLIIESYLLGNYDKVSTIDPISGRIVEINSKEAVLYFNSVKNICDIIKRCGLTPDNANILCSNTSINRRAIKKAFKISCGRTDGDIGSVPKRGECHKMFTLCTRTVYLGADFYSTNAKSFIFSDANIDCLAVDISLDLPQILGRQRLSINPWKNCATLYFKNLRNNERLSQEDFNNLIVEKTNSTNDLIDIFYNQTSERAQETYIKALKELAEVTNYRTNYIAVDYDKSTGKLLPVLNKLVMISEMRAFDIQQIDYKDRFSVLAAVDTVSDAQFFENSKVNSIILQFESLSSFQDRMRLLCTADLTELERDAVLNSVPEVFKSYYYSLGPKRCSAVGYMKYKLKSEYDRIVGNQQIDISEEIYSRFEVGKKYPLFEIKDFLSDLYKRSGYNAVAKAVDLERYFEVVSTRVSLSINGVSKRIHAYEIIRRL